MPAQHLIRVNKSHLVAVIILAAWIMMVGLMAFLAKETVDIEKATEEF